MSIPANAKLGDFFLVSYDGKKPNLTDVPHWLTHGGFVRVGQYLDGGGFSQFEHAAIFLGNNQTSEAAPNGVHIGTVSQFGNDELYWSTGILTLTDAQRTAIVAAARKYVGVPYSWVDYAAIAAHHLNILPNDPDLQEYVATSKHMICSQLVDQCYADAGYHLFTDNRWPGYVTPADLYNLLVSIKAKR